MTTSLAMQYAIRALTRRHSGGWTDVDESQLQAWLGAAPEHQAAYDKVARVWTDTGSLAGRFSRQSLTPRLIRHRAVVAACVAAVIAAMAIPVWHVGFKWWNGEAQRWTAAPDETRALVLGDGTHVLLDAGSEIVTTIGWHARRVSLERGEALLTVSHDPSRPFVLESGSGRVSDLGTRFDIELVGGSTRITVLEGRVGVSTPREAIALAAGQAGGYDRHGVLLPVRAADSSAVLWSAGKRRFDSEPLPDVLERLGRYHGVAFVLSEPRLQTLQVSGTFRVDDLSLFLRTLGAALPLETRQIGPQQIEIRARADSISGTSGGHVDVGAPR